MSWLIYAGPVAQTPEKRNKTVHQQPKQSSWNKQTVAASGATFNIYELLKCDSPPKKKKPTKNEANTMTNGLPCLITGFQWRRFPKHRWTQPGLPPRPVQLANLWEITNCKSSGSNLQNMLLLSPEDVCCWGSETVKVMCANDLSSWSCASWDIV